MLGRILVFAVLVLVGLGSVAPASEGYSYLVESPPENSRSSGTEEGFVVTDDGTRLFYQKVGAGKKTVIIPGGLFLYAALLGSWK